MPSPQEVVNYYCVRNIIIRYSLQKKIKPKLKILNTKIHFCDEIGFISPVSVFVHLLSKFTRPINSVNIILFVICSGFIQVGL